MRGYGGNSASLGQKQGDAIRNITGDFSLGALNDIGFDEDNVTGVFSATGRQMNKRAQNAGRFSGKACKFDASLVVPVAAENRPVNKAVKYAIKAR